MSLLDIHVLGSPILRHETTPVTAVTDEMRRLIDEGIGYGLALEGISAANVAQAATEQHRPN